MGIKRSARKFLKSKSMTLVYVTAVVIVFFYLMNNNYLSRDNISGMMNSMSITGITAIGISYLLMGGGINLASGAQGCFGALVVALSMSAGVPWLPALIFGLIFGMCAGLINSFFINKLGFMSFITTLGMSSIFSGLGIFISNNNNLPISNQSFWQIGTYNLFNFFPMPFVIMVIFTIIYGFILVKTRFGRSVLMCGGNRAAARLAGLNPQRISTILYMNCGAFAVLAGSVLAARMHHASPSALASSTLDGITASVLGGVSFGGGSGSITGMFIGVLLLTAFNNGLVVINVYSYWQLVSQGAVLIVALCLDFFSTKARTASMKKASMKKIA